MSGQDGSRPGGGGRERDWVEIVAALLLALAAAPPASGSRRPARPAWPRPRPRSTWRRSLQWVNADTTNDKALAGCYRRRFRPEFRPAFSLLFVGAVAWIVTFPVSVSI